MRPTTPSLPILLVLPLLLTLATPSQASTASVTSQEQSVLPPCDSTSPPASTDREEGQSCQPQAGSPTAVAAMAASLPGIQPLALGDNLFPPSGNVGIGTDTPQKTLHMVTNNTPTIRFEQTNAGGYRPYAWDVGGNETNFFIRDQSAQGITKLPFRIAPGNAENTLTLNNSRVGIGTWNPASALHVIGNVQVSNLINCSNGLITDANGVFGCASAPQAGAKGPDGDKGPAGDKGTTGDTGAVGDKGPTGDKGTTGDTGAVGDKGPIGNQGPDGNAGIAGVDLQQAIDHADAGDQATRQQIDQVEQAATQRSTTLATQALEQANAYTDQQIQALNDDFQQIRRQIDQRQRATDRRISQVGALATAMSQMGIHSLPTQPGRGRLAVGVGSQDGENAMSVGYGKRIGRATLSLGGAFGGGEKNIGAGFGIDL
jgi:hypothetical protein